MQIADPRCIGGLVLRKAPTENPKYLNLFEYAPSAPKQMQIYAMPATDECVFLGEIKLQAALLALGGSVWGSGSGSGLP